MEKQNFSLLPDKAHSLELCTIMEIFLVTHNLPVMRRKYQITRLDFLTELHCPLSLCHPMEHQTKLN